MSNWIEQNIDLGSVKVGVRQKIIFQRVVEKPLVVELRAGCGCSKPTLHKKDNQVIVLYTPQVIPQHLKLQGSYNTTKSIAVIYEDDSKEILTFRGKIIE